MLNNIKNSYNSSIKNSNFMKSSILIVKNDLINHNLLEVSLNNSLKNFEMYTVKSIDEAKEILKILNFNLVVFDIKDCSEGDIIDLYIIKRFQAAQKDIKTLIISNLSSEDYEYRFLKKGANGFLNSDCTIDKINRVICNILHKGHYISEETQKKIVLRRQQRIKISLKEHLSNREYEITKLLVKGKKTGEIAEILNIALSTVSTYKNRIFFKAKVSDVVELARIFNEENN